MLNVVPMTWVLPVEFKPRGARLGPHHELHSQTPVEDATPGPRTPESRAVVHDVWRRVVNPVLGRGVPTGHRCESFQGSAEWVQSHSHFPLSATCHVAE